MNKKHMHLSALICVALLLRMALFERVGVFGDFGYWAYDSRMITQGLTPFVDFPGRSPLMVYLLAVVRDLLGVPAVTLRGTVITLWLLASLPVYAIARKIHSHRAGIAAMGAFLLLPFPLVYGMWLNSQSLGALLSLLGVYAVFRYDNVVGYGTAGVLIGSAFLARRSTIVILAAIAVFTIWRVARQSSSSLTVFSVAVASRGSAIATAFGGTLFAGYVAVAGGDVQTGLAILNMDFVGLFASDGRGAYPLLGVEATTPEPVIEGGGLPIINDICPACGAWTARRGLKMLILATPVVGFFTLWGRDVVEQLYSSKERMYLLGIFGSLLAYAIWLSAANGFVYRGVALGALLTFALSAWSVYDVDREVLYSPGMRFVLAIMTLMVVGYLVRDRRIIVYYMMDNWAYLSIAAGVLGVHFWNESTRRCRRLLIVALLLSVVASAGVAAPLGNVGGDSGWFTVDDVHAVKEDLDSRANPDDRILSPHPTYVSMSESRLWMDNSRVYLDIVTFEGAQISDKRTRQLTGALEAGRVEFVIYNGMTRDVFGKDPGLQDAFDQYYCPVGASVYDRTNASLYRYHGGGACAS